MFPCVFDDSPDGLRIERLKKKGHDHPMNKSNPTSIFHPIPQALKSTERLSSSYVHPVRVIYAADINYFNN